MASETRQLYALASGLGLVERSNKDDPFRWISFEEGSRLIEQLKRFVRSAEIRAAKKVGDG